MGGEFWIGVVAGGCVGLVLGLGYAAFILRRIVELAEMTGKDVLQARRLAVHVSQEYAPLKGRVERLERLVGGPHRELGPS